MLQRLTALWYTAAADPRSCSPSAGCTALRSRCAAAPTGAAGCARARIARPVIVIGNLTVGGTGKTPLTLWLAERLRASGAAVGIVSRGYGRRSGRGARGARRLGLARGGR